MTVSSPSGSPIGRDDELDRLRHLLHDAMDGAGRSVWIEGEPGIGKSALLESFLNEAAALGCRIRVATAEEFGRRLPLHAMLDCLGAEPGSGDPELGEIAALLSCDGATGRPPDPVAVAAERLLSLVDRLSTDEPLIVAVDDLQWADEASILLLHRLNRLAQRRPLLVIGACRPVPRRSDLVTLKRGLAHAGAEVITLAPLPPSAVTRLTTQLTAELTGAHLLGVRLRRAAELAGGNPAYLREMVDTLIREDRVRRQEDTAELTGEAGTGLPRALTDAISDRLGFLSADTTDLLRSATLLGSAFSVTDLGAIVGRSALELTAALEEATAAGVLTESEVLLAFRHTLIRQALYERSPAGLRLALHLQAARALADAGLAVERVAEQLLAALRGPDAVPVVDGWTVDWLLRAGRRLVTRAPEDAAELLRLAVAYLPSDDPRRESLEVILAPALVLLGQRGEAIRLVEKVLAATVDPARAAEMSWTAGWAMTDDHRHEAALAVLGRALQVPGLDDVWSARLHAMLARAAIADGDLTQAEAATRLALAEADRSGDRQAAAGALNAAGILATHHGDLDAAAVRFGHALAIAEQCDDPETHELRLRLRQSRAYVLLAQERHADADLAARELLAEAERSASPPRLACARILIAEVHYHAGRWTEAVAQLDAAAASDDLIPAADRQWLHGLAAVIAVHRDDQATAEAHLSAVPAVATVYAGAQYVPLARALLAERRDLTDEALSILTGLLDRTGVRPAYHRHIWLPTLLRLALGDGNAELARAVATAGSAVSTDRPTSSLAAVARHCAGLLESDHVTLTLAADAYRAAGRPLHLAQTLEDTAVVLAERGDARAARAAHAEAAELYTGLGATWDLLRADTRLRRHGVQRRRGPRRRAVTGWDALTPAELTVARLVAEGRPNPDIAANLFVSRRTVEVHVSHILAKLGVRSRVEIAREAARRFAAAMEEHALSVPSARAG
ncbi:LuxR family transcriptional regulator [Actinomadura sp. DC4]|uniref:ATP-binding protein n=1 Tax=Actinomadura sp. DC4 TaxID=3055069 RepID=UPI0025AF4079|nr:LuxR family transcriptional regulator [Actinomadura sp. DC4]MDN3357657.1 AAA family ATPase [Actinomadura sp. DC4]